jgi:hypothetical protein
MFLRWLGLHRTWTLPGVLLGPLLWPFDQEAAGLIAATAVFATATGARWHLDNLPHGADRAEDARERRAWTRSASECSGGPTVAVGASLRCCGSACDADGRRRRDARSSRGGPIAVDRPRATIPVAT